VWIYISIETLLQISRYHNMIIISGSSTG